MKPASERLRPLLQFGDDGLQRIHVHIGDVRVAAAESVLFTIGLGSCVAVALYDAELRIGGLIHAMLPDPVNGRSEVPRGRFATTAIPLAVELLEEHGAARSRLTARLAGGASMFRDVLDGDGLRLGRRNVDAARATLQQLQVPVAGEDVLGAHGRSVYFRTSDGLVLVTSVRHGTVTI
jgi:chemotaxis protein CheD